VLRAIYLTVSATVFDLYGNERLNEWRKVRTEVENSDNPYQLVADVWSRAPFVNPYLDPKNPAEWPDPWHLILDDRFDDLAIPLGMLYTFKLTRRFMETLCEIHTSVSPNDDVQRFILVIDNKHVLNYEPRTVITIEQLPDRANKIWSVTKLP
jgi:hypothetical protein